MPTTPIKYGAVLCVRGSQIQLHGVSVSASVLSLSHRNNTYRRHSHAMYEKHTKKFFSFFLEKRKFRLPVFSKNGFRPKTENVAPMKTICCGDIKKLLHVPLLLVYSPQTALRVISGWCCLHIYVSLMKQVTAQAVRVISGCHGCNIFRFWTESVF